SHEDIAKDHGDMVASMDRPAAALLKDLKSRGLLDDTIVIWTTEFGRMPCSQGSKGRDHNPYGFTSWLAAAASKAGSLTAKAMNGPTEPFTRPPIATTCTLPFCTCSASTTRS